MSIQLTNITMTHTMQQKLTTEFIGTFFLSLTICTAAVYGSAGDYAPFGIAATLMVMIYAGGYISGAHYNPAVTVSIYLRGACEKDEVLPYIASQVIAAVSAAIIVENLLFPDALSPEMADLGTDAVVAEVVQKFFPDFRLTLNELQRYAASGVIDTGILAQISQVRLEKLVGALKSKDFGATRKWIVANLDNDPNTILRTVYDSLYGALAPASIPQAVLIIAKYQYQSAFVADQEINLLAALTEIMVECQFK